MKKSLQKIEIIIFAALLVVPSLVWLVARNQMDTSNLENREKAQLIWNQGQDISVFATLSNWFEDNVPYKNQAVRLKNTFDLRVFGRVSSNQILCGEEDWLFYWNSSELSRQQYKGIYSLSEQELAEYQDEVIAARDNLQQQGVSLYIIAAPNKEEIKRSYVPSYVLSQGSDCSLGQLEEALEASGFSGFLNASTCLRQADKTMSTYFQLDSHWNYYGGYVAYCEYAKMAGLNIPQRTFKKMEKQGGDLATMINLKAWDQATFSPVTSIESETLESSVGDRRVSKAASPERESAYIIGDSYRGYIWNYFLDNYASVNSMAAGEYIEAEEAFEKPDDIVIVFVGRNISNQHELLKRLATEEFM